MGGTDSIENPGGGRPSGAGSGRFSRALRRAAQASEGPERTRAKTQEARAKTQEQAPTTQAFALPEAEPGLFRPFQA